MANVIASAHASKMVQLCTVVSGTKASSGANELVAAPGTGTRIVVKEIVVQNESSTETTAILKSATTAYWRGKLAANAALSIAFADGDEARLGTNEALNLVLDGANSHGYSVRYFTEAV
jgi:hypothetical protein